jgi:hypothetical protein
LRVSLLAAMPAISSFHEATKDAAPSFWSVAASAETSTPAFPNRPSVSSASPPLEGRGALSSPWLPKARRVASGMVLTVFGAASALT